MIHYLSIFDPLSLLPRYSHFPKPVRPRIWFPTCYQRQLWSSGARNFFVGKQFFLARKSFLEAALRHSRFLPSVPSVNKTERDDDRNASSTARRAHWRTIVGQGSTGRTSVFTGQFEVSPRQQSSSCLWPGVEGDTCSLACLWPGAEGGVLAP
jgi:hypothetical protein